MNLVDDNYSEQMCECEAKITKLRQRIDRVNAVNYRTYQELQILLESAVAEITQSVEYTPTPSTSQKMIDTNTIVGEELDVDLS